MIFIVDLCHDLNHDLNRFKSFYLNHVHPGTMHCQL